MSDIDVEIYEFDTTASDPLYENLIKLKDMPTKYLSEKSKIQERYWIRILEIINQKKVNSLYELCNYKIDEKRVIGKTNIERLYLFLSNND